MVIADWEKGFRESISRDYNRKVAAQPSYQSWPAVHSSGQIPNRRGLDHLYEALRTEPVRI
jgi:hypothetical protein